MAITNVQAASGTSAASSTSVSATLSSGATAGNLIWFAAGLDKSAGTITPPAGFTALVSHSSTSVSTYVGYKVATGGETTVTVSRSSASTSGDTAWVGEFADSGSGSWQVISTATHTTDESTVTSWSSGTAADPAQTCAAIGFFAIDSGSSGSGSQSWSNSYVGLFGWANSGLGGIAVGWLSSTAGGSTKETTHTHTATADQMSGAIATFARVSTSLTGTLAETMTMTGGLLLGAAFTGASSTAMTMTSALTVLSHLFVGTLEIELTAGVWTDFTSRTEFRSGPLRIRQGRPTPFDDVGAATMTCVLSNVDGDLMPDNPFAAYHPNFVEGKRIRWSVTKGSSAFTRFTGWIQDIRPEFPSDHTNKTTVTILATDALGLLAQKKLRSPSVEEAIYRGVVDGFTVDAVEFVGETNGTVSIGTNYSEDASPGGTTGATSTTWPNLEFGAPDSDISAEGMATAQVNDDGDVSETLLHTQPNTRYVEFMFKTPEKLIPDANAYCIGSLQDNGFTNICHVAIAKNGTVNALFLMNAAFTTNLGLMNNVPFGQWVRVEIFPTGGLNSSTTTTASAQIYGGSSAGVLSAAVDMRGTRYVNLPGAVAPKVNGSWASLNVKGGTTNVVGHSWYTHWTAGSVTSLFLRWQWLTGFTSRLPVSWNSAGTATAAAMMGTTAGKYALQDLQAVMRTGRGVAWARPWDGHIVAAFADGGVRPSVPVAVIDLDTDCIGSPSLDRGVDQRPTRIEMTWPGGKALAVDQAAEAGGITRSKSYECYAATQAAAQTLAGQILADGAGGTRISKVTLDLVAPQTDHTDVLLSESGTLGGLFPLQRIRTWVPTSHFGLPTRDHHVQGWEEAYHPDYVTLTMDTTPVALTTYATETWTGSNGAAWPAQWTAHAGSGGAITIQTNRGRISPGTTAGVTSYATLNTGPYPTFHETITVTLNDAASTARILYRYDSGFTAGYYLQLDTSGTVILKRQGGPANTLASAAIALSAATAYKVRIVNVSGWHGAKVWAAAGSEPAGWQLQATDTGLVADGYVGLLAVQDGTAVSKTVDFDDFTLMEA